MERLLNRLNRRVDPAPLAAFRILFGALMAFEAFSSYLHKVPERYSADLFHFTYPGFHWVSPPPGFGVYLLILAMGLSAFCVTIGYRYRGAALVFLFSYTYIFLIERTAYNNHYYFIILLGILFCVTDAHSEASLDYDRLSPERRGWIPAWQLYLFRAQVFLVYFFGGVAKLSPDWLQREPISQWLEARAARLAIGPILELDVMPYLFAYGGLAFDLSIGFLLLWRRSRLFAIALVMGFHLTNAYLFSIGVFPWLGIGATVLFLEGPTVRRMLDRLGYSRGPAPDSSKADAGPGLARPALILIAVYMAIQVSLPMRHAFIPGNVNWTEEGHDFSWHMKLRDKEGVIRITVAGDYNKVILDEAALTDELTQKQVDNMSHRPVLVAQYARHLRRSYEDRGWKNPRVYVEDLVSLNGRPYLPLIDSTADLSRAEDPPLGGASWIVPFDSTAPLGVYPPRPELPAD